MVNVKQLVESVKRIAWKAGTHETVQHVVEPDGSHTIIVKVPASVAEWTAPEVLPTPAVYRGLTWDELKPPTKGSTK